MLTDLRAVHQFTVHLSGIRPIPIGQFKGRLLSLTQLPLSRQKVFKIKNLTIFELKKCPKITEST